MTLYRALTAARINETLDNYVRADQVLTAKPVKAPVAPSDRIAFETDKSFWQIIFNDKRRLVNKVFNFSNLIVSEWVPRYTRIGAQA